MWRATRGRWLPVSFQNTQGGLGGLGCLASWHGSSELLSSEDPLGPQLITHKPPSLETLLSYCQGLSSSGGVRSGQRAFAPGEVETSPAGRRKKGEGEGCPGHPAAHGSRAGEGVGIARDRGRPRVLTHGQPQDVVGAGQGEAEPLGVVAHGLGEARRGSPAGPAAKPPRAPDPWDGPTPPPSRTTHRPVQQSQQVLLIGVQQSDLRPAGPPGQVGAQGQAEHSQQPHAQGGQQRGALRVERPRGRHAGRGLAVRLPTTSRPRGRPPAAAPEPSRAGGHRLGVQGGCTALRGGPGPEPRLGVGCTALRDWAGATDAGQGEGLTGWKPMTEHLVVRRGVRRQIPQCAAGRAGAWRGGRGGAGPNGAWPDGGVAGA